MINQVIKGDLIKLALEGKFNAIAHGVNCQCVQRSGIAKPMAATFNTDKFIYEKDSLKGSIDKLGNIDWALVSLHGNTTGILELHSKVKRHDTLIHQVYAINCYTQFLWATPGKPNPLDYSALALCFTKINAHFKEYHLGIPKIGAGLAGGDWITIADIIDKVTPNVNITLVEL